MTDPMPEQLPESEAPFAEPEMSAEQAAEAERRSLEQAIGPLFDRGRRGANWFFWIAALSLVNSVIMWSRWMDSPAVVVEKAAWNSMPPVLRLPRWA